MCCAAGAVSAPRAAAPTQHTPAQVSEELLVLWCLSSSLTQCVLVIDSMATWDTVTNHQVTFQSHSYTTSLCPPATHIQTHTHTCKQTHTGVVTIPQLLLCWRSCRRSTPCPQSSWSTGSCTSSRAGSWTRLRTWPARDRGCSRASA